MMFQFATNQRGAVSATLRTFVVTVLVGFASSAHAASSGGFAIGVLGGLTSSTQENLNTLQSRANSRAGGISTPALNSAYEFAVEGGYRFQGSMIAIALRPSFFYQKATGGNAGGNYDYGVTGFTIFPMLRLHPLENNFMRFFINVGIGYGRATTEITEVSATATAVGSSFGTVAGLGTEFCFTPQHCMSVEGNYRYLLMERNVVSDSSGTFDPSGLSQYTKNSELEMNNDDVKIRMSGLQFLLGYVMHF